MAYHMSVSLQFVVYKTILVNMGLKLWHTSHVFGNTSIITGLNMDSMALLAIDLDL